MDVVEMPQYLHVYFDFSEPSYSLCLPLPEPSGWRGQLIDVRLATLDDVVPQYSHCTFAMMNDLK